MNIEIPKVRVNIPGLVEGEITLEGITILMGSPMTGKTTLQKMGVKGAESLASLRRGWIAPLYLYTPLPKFP
jgi:hypothetical protein